jgi:hypothetical protein
MIARREIVSSATLVGVMALLLDIPSAPLGAPDTPDTSTISCTGI